MIVEVFRGAGDRIGSPITEPLLSNDMLIVRGRAEMNANAHDMIEHSGEVAFRSGMMLGQPAQFDDAASLRPIRAKITSISISIVMSQGASPSLSMDTHVVLRGPK